MVMVAESGIWKSALMTGALAAGLIYAAPNAQALDLTIGGAFDDPQDVFLVEFSVDGPGPFVLFTAFTSNFDPANSLTDPTDPILTLFSGTGGHALLEDDNDDGAHGFSAAVNGVIFTGGSVDSLLEVSLPVGDYTLGVSSFPNFAEGPSLGNGYSNFDFGTGGSFRVHLLGVDEILGTQGPAPVSPSFPRRDFIS